MGGWDRPGQRARRSGQGWWRSRARQGRARHWATRAVAVAVTNSGLEGLTGEALRSAVTDGLRTAMYVGAAGIALTALAALGLRKPRTPRGRHTTAESRPVVHV